MATIQIKYSVTTATPPSLLQGELAFSEASDTLFIGDSTGTVLPIGGEGVYAPLNSPIFVGTPQAPTPGAASNDTTIATTAFVTTAVSNVIAGGGYAPLDSPPFTGIPTAPTAAPGTSTTQIATTQFVMSQNFITAADIPVTSVAGMTGDVLLDVADVSGAAPLDSPTFTGLATSVTPAVGDSSAAIATTAFVMGQGFITLADVPAQDVTSVFGRTGDVLAATGDYDVTEVTGAAPTASPVFTGTPMAPTPAAADNSLRIATTAWVTGQGYVTAADAPVTSVAGMTGDVLLDVADVTGAAPLDSPTFTGNATAPTVLDTDNSAAIATTAWVNLQNYLTAATSLVTSVAGKTGDVSLVVADVPDAAPLASPALTGTPTAPTPAAADDSTAIATTAYVQSQGFATALTVTSGTFTKVTVNTEGLVTAGSSLVAADIPKTLDNTWITDFDAQVQTNRLDQMAAPTAAVNMNNQLLSGLADPVGTQDAATRGYVDGVAQGLDIKESCACASDGANLTLSGLTPVDGYTPVAGDRVLVKDQTNAVQNGIYVAATGAWTRATDFSGATATSGAFTFISGGTVNSATSWVVTTPDPITTGTTPVAWAQFSGAGTYQASGNGIVLNGNVFDLVGVPGEINTSPAGIGIDSTGTGTIQGMIDTSISNATINGGTF